MKRGRGLFGQEGNAADYAERTQAAAVPPTANKLEEAAQRSPPAVQASRVTHPELVNDTRAPAALAYVIAHPQETVVENKNLWYNYQLERLFNNILGTQFQLLEFLERQPVGTAVPLAEIAPFHARHQQLTGGSNYPLDQYVAFLMNLGVIAAGRTQTDPRYTNSADGLKFLSYIGANYTNPAGLRPG